MFVTKIILSAILFTFLSKKVIGETISVKEGDTFVLNCGNLQIFIESAEWTYEMGNPENLSKRDFRTLIYLFGKLFKMCTYDRSQVVKNKCHGRYCEFKVDRTTFGNDCDYVMELNVEYSCGGYFVLNVDWEIP